jgi:predicted dehydrogenase
VQNSIRWGILGTGNIARTFAEALKSLPDAALLAVGSRTQAAADAFADRFDIPRRHASYGALAKDPEVDVIYVATPHALHKDNTILALRSGKAVLCEKPFTINARESEEVFTVAVAERRFVMEAMWTRFIPAVKQARQWIDDGAIGEVRMVQAAFGYRDDAPLLFDPALGGGSLLDVGIYPITLAHWAFGGPPERIASLAHLGRNGVDEQGAYVLGYPGGGLAVLSAAVQTKTPYDGYILGTDGMITLHAPFWCPSAATLSVEGKDDLRVELPLACNGYEYEAVEVMECIRAGRTESEVMPRRITIEAMQIMDDIRKQWGLRYPME